MTRKHRAKRARARAKKRTQKTSGPSSPKPERPIEQERSTSVNKAVLLVGIIVLAGLAVLVAFLGRDQDTEETGQASAIAEEATDVEKWEAAPLEEIPYAPGRDYALGPEDAPVRIVEFSDFQCPYCREASDSLKRVLSQHEGRVQLVFKNYPLDTACNPYMSQQLHPLACEAAAMARCAGAQEPELFWAMHDALFELSDFTEEALGRLPEELGVDMEAFTACLAEDETMPAIREDIEQGRSLGVTGTPTLFVNGREAPAYWTGTLGDIIEHISSAP